MVAVPRRLSAATTFASRFCRCAMTFDLCFCVRDGAMARRQCDVGRVRLPQRFKVRRIERRAAGSPSTRHQVIASEQQAGVVDQHT
jgi:hypothetical protein